MYSNPYSCLISFMAGVRKNKDKFFFAGGGFGAFFFGMGVVKYFKKVGYLPREIYAESAGCGVALYLLNPDTDLNEHYLYWCETSAKVSRRALFSDWNKLVGANFNKRVIQCDRLFERANERLSVSITEKFRHNWQSVFTSNDDVYDAVRASSHVPFYNYVSDFGLQKIDGFFSSYMRKMDSDIIRVGMRGDIKPSYKVTMRDVFLYNPARTPALYAEGYLQAKRYLRDHNIALEHDGAARADA